MLVISVVMETFSSIQWRLVWRQSGGRGWGSSGVEKNWCCIRDGCSGSDGGSWLLFMVIMS